MEPSIAQLEAHALRAWPATISRPTEDGWVLRATPGLSRGRSNHALTPVRPLEPDEIAPALERVRSFALEHGIRPGIQVSPLHLHERLQRELDARGWSTQWPTLVLTRAPRGRKSAAGPRFSAPAESGNLPRTAAPEAPQPRVETEASPDWLALWGSCEGRDDVDAHARTVFARLRGKAQFVSLPGRGAAIAVPGDGLLGIFSVAVRPDLRRHGIGRALMLELLALEPSATVYLQVESRNAPALSLCDQLGFQEAYCYCHRLAPR